MSWRTKEQSYGTEAGHGERKEKRLLQHPFNDDREPVDGRLPQRRVARTDGPYCSGFVVALPSTLLHPHLGRARDEV